jgi:hypothetical protein
MFFKQVKLRRIKVIKKQKKKIKKIKIRKRKFMYIEKRI